MNLSLLACSPTANRSCSLFQPAFHACNRSENCKNCPCRSSVMIHQGIGRKAQQSWHPFGPCILFIILCTQLLQSHESDSAVGVTGCMTKVLRKGLRSPYGCYCSTAKSCYDTSQRQPCICIICQLGARQQQQILSRRGRYGAGCLQRMQACMTTGWRGVPDAGSRLLHPDDAGLVGGGALLGKRLHYKGTRGPVQMYHRVLRASG